jgi:sulfur carrier protein ThiS
MAPGYQAQIRTPLYKGQAIQQTIQPPITMARIRITVSVNGTNTPYHLDAGVTPQRLLDNPDFRSDFSISSNSVLLVNGRESSTALREGDRITVQARASQKAARIRVTVSVNGTNTPYHMDAGVTPQRLLDNPDFRSDFSISANSVLLVNGRESSTALREGDRITVQARASQKAARIRVTVSVNGTNTPYHMDAGVTPQRLLDNPDFRSDFSISANSVLLVNGRESSTALREGDRITVQARASQKAL